jgi:hypothetical protein
VLNFGVKKIKTKKVILYHPEMLIDIVVKNIYLIANYVTMNIQLLYITYHHFAIGVQNVVVKIKLN